MLVYYWFRGKFRHVSLSLCLQETLRSWCILLRLSSFLQPSQDKTCSHQDRIHTSNSGCKHISCTCRLRTPLRQLPSLILEACYYAFASSDFNSDYCNELFTLITCRVGGGRRIEGQLTLTYFVVNKDGFITCFGCNVAPRGPI
jgi:hypothetical protein